MNAAIFLFILVFFLFFTKFSLSFSHVRGIMMSTKEGSNMKSYRTYSSILSANHPQNPRLFCSYTYVLKSVQHCFVLYKEMAYSASIKSNEDRFHMMIQVLEELNGVVDELNVIRQKHHSAPFHIIDHEHRFVSMQHLDGFLNCVTRSITVLFLRKQIRTYCICCIVTGKAFLLL